MEKLLNSACSDVLVEDECRHLISETDALQAKADCISVFRNSGGNVSEKCYSQLSAVEALLSADYRTNPELQKDCKMDTSVLCPAEIERSATAAGFSTEVIQCLVQQRGRIRNSNCKKQILRQIYKMSEDVMYVPEMRAVCNDDISQFCSGIQPGGGRLHDCLRDHLGELSHECQAQEFAIEQMEDLAASTAESCRSELNSYCKDSTKKLHCLWRNVDEATQECQLSVKKEMKGKIGNIWLDPSLYSKCRTSVNQLIRDPQADKCPSYLVELPPPRDGLIPLPLNYTQAIAGEHVACLGSNRAKIGDVSCLNSVEALLRMEAADPLLMRFGLRTACRSELSLNGVCGFSDPFDTVEQWKCLQGVFKDDSRQLGASCSDSVKRMWRLSLFDVKFNTDISKNCEFEIGSLCKGIGSSKTIVCLSEKYGTDRMQFSEECGEAIKRMPPPSSLDMENMWTSIKTQIENAPKTSLEDLPVVEQLRLLKQAGITASSEGGIEISGPLAFVSLTSLVLVIMASLYKLYRYKMNKGYMVIVEKD
jgi:hypothetical protein